MNQIFENIWERKFTFLVTFFFVFTLTYLLFLALDLLPEPPVEDTTTEQVSETTDVSENNDSSGTIESLTGVVGGSSDHNLAVAVDNTSVVPVSISIKKLDKTIPVLNPNSRAVADLDAALLEGVVRHPDSAHLAQDGNVFILGHSSYLPNVINRNFQAFNGIQNLAWGDTIEVYSVDAVFTYRVEKVYRAKAQDVTVPIAGDEKLLTLATCNSFGSVDDRYIVEAKQTGVRKL